MQRMAVAVAALVLQVVVATLGAFKAVGLGALVDQFLFLALHMAAVEAGELLIVMLGFIHQVLLAAVAEVVMAHYATIKLAKKLMLLLAGLILVVVAEVELEVRVLRALMVEAVLLQLDGDSNNGTLR